MKPRRIRREGAYIIKAAESRPLRVDELRRLCAHLPPRPAAVVTDADRALVRALLTHRKGTA